MLPLLLGGAAIGGLSSIISNIIQGSNQRSQQRRMQSGAPMMGMNVGEGLSQLPKFNQQQNQALSQLLQSGLSGWNQNKPDFGPIRDAAINRFNTETIPGLSERFTAMGGGQRSSAFQNALGSAGGALNQNLAAMQQQFGQQDRNQLLQLLQLGLQSPYEYLYKERQPGFLESATTSALPGLMQALPGLLQLYQGS